jgi:hypothetical protein
MEKFTKVLKLPLKFNVNKKLRKSVKMGRKCAIFKCSNRSSKCVQLFQLPKSQERKRLWLKFIKEQNKEENKNGEQFLCCNHFSERSWKFNNARSRLREDAIPTIGCTHDEKVIFAP